jgi:hypothetical protein
MKAIKYVLLVLFFACASTMMAVDYKLHQTSSAKVKSTATLEYYGVSGNTAIFHLAHSASFKEISSAPKMCFQSTSTMSRVGSSLPQATETGVTTTTDHLTLRGPARIGGGNSGGGSGPNDKTDPWKTPIGDALLPLLLLVAVYVVFDMLKRRNQLDKQTE